MCHREFVCLRVDFGAARIVLPGECRPEDTERVDLCIPGEFALSVEQRLGDGKGPFIVAGRDSDLRGCQTVAERNVGRRAHSP